MGAFTGQLVDRDEFDGLEVVGDLCPEVARIVAARPSDESDLRARRVIVVRVGARVSDCDVVSVERGHRGALRVDARGDDAPFQRIRRKGAGFGGGE